jgi:hypothetical protein
MTIQKVIVPVLIICSTVASNASTYVPFTFNDPAISQRADIRDKIPKLRVEIPAGSETKYRSIPVSDGKITLRQEVARLALAAASPAPFVNLGKLMKVPATECAAHESLTIDDFKISSRAECSNVAKVFDAALASNVKSCRYVYQPERFVEDQPAGVVDPARLQTFEGLIALAGEALQHIDIPGNLVPLEDFNVLRSVFAKIRTEKLSAAIQVQAGKYKAAETALTQMPSCSDQTTAKNLSRLQAELAATQNFLQTLNTNGLAQATRDRQAVEAKGRRRVQLPFPSMTDAERKLFSFYLGGIYWRIRGAGLIEKARGTNDTRKFFNLYPSRLLGDLNGGKVGVMAGETFIARLKMKGWGDWFRMGQDGSANDKYFDLTMMTDRGLYQVRGAADVLENAGYGASELVAGGLQMGPVYYFAWDFLKGHDVAEDLKSPYSALFSYPTQWGEMLVGSAMYLALSEALLNGTTAK